MRLLLLGLIGIAATAQTVSGVILYSPEGNRLRRYDIDSIVQPPLREDVFIERAGLDAENGRDVNGEVCPFPDDSGRFVMGEDTGQPDVPPGWGVFSPAGLQIGKLTATYFVEPQGDPFGCAFDAQGRLFTTEIGNSAMGPATGQLIVWFPPFDTYPGEPGTYPNGAHSTNFCKISSEIATATSLAIDAEGRLYVVSARGGGGTSGGTVLRFSPPFPTAPTPEGGCSTVDALGSPVADVVNREVFIFDTNAATPSGLAQAPNGNWYVASVLTGVIAEYDPNGVFVRRVLEPELGGSLPWATGHPQGLAVDADGNLFYADLNLRLGPRGIGPGPNGSVRWIAFDAQNTPAPPVVIKEHLAFPDALGLFPGSLPPCTEGCAPACVGDCNGNGQINIAELVTGVSIALGDAQLDICALLDRNESARVEIGELIATVAAALHGCPT
ncbi:MAG: hypothetical protein ACRERC_09465 [Candidatus Binatia bacterium]